ncbi:hypothetical protein FGB62_481g03 [Gracilaria domingensis]|nr:hypothetical protein FGB62_481g03 [Gracilaria domingensis]
MRRAPRRAFALDAIATGCRPPAREAAKARAPGMVPAAYRAAAYRATAASLARVVPPVDRGRGRWEINNHSAPGRTGHLLDDIAVRHRPPAHGAAAAHSAAWCLSGVEQQRRVDVRCCPLLSKFLARLALPASDKQRCATVRCPT